MLHFKFIEFDCMTSCDFLDCVSPLYRIQTLLNTNEPFCAGLKTFFLAFVSSALQNKIYLDPSNSSYFRTI